MRLSISVFKDATAKWAKYTLSKSPFLEWTWWGLSASGAETSETSHFLAVRYSEKKKWNNLPFPSICICLSISVCVCVSLFACLFVSPLAAKNNLTNPPPFRWTPPCTWDGRYAAVQTRYTSLSIVFFHTKLLWLLHEERRVKLYTECCALACGSLATRHPSLWFDRDVLWYSLHIGFWGSICPNVVDALMSNNWFKCPPWR